MSVNYRHILRWSACLLVVVVGASFLQFRLASQEASRAAAIEYRDEWVADTIIRLKNGHSSVELYSCINTDFMLESVASMPEVKSISLKQTIDLSDSGLAHLPSFPNLNSISFTSESSITDNSIIILTDCLSLHRIEILEPTAVSDEGIIKLLSKMPQLEEFCHSGQFSETMLAAARPDLKIERRPW